MDIRDKRAGLWNSWAIDGKRMVLRSPWAGDDREFAFEWVVCPTCRGKGKHVNAGIDAHGLTADDECWDDPDFAEDYCSGKYDVTCVECGGRRVVPECNDEEFLEELSAELSYREEREAERRMGA